MDTELVTVWNGTMSRNYRPFTEHQLEIQEPLEPLPAKEPHDCHWRAERQKVLDLMADGQARRIAAIGYELGIESRVLHGFMQRWKRADVFRSVPGRYGFVRLNRSAL